MKLWGVFLCIVALAGACSKNSDEQKPVYMGNWSEETPFKDRAISGAVCFEIGDVVYMGLGRDTNKILLKDFWKRTPAGGWEIIANDFIGGARYGASAFVLDGKAYVGLGYRPAQVDGTMKMYYNDFYEFDPADDSWTRIEDCPCIPRRDAVAFTLGDNGYVGSGQAAWDQLTNDFYAFNKTTRRWTFAGSAGEKRTGATAFVIDEAAYVCLGAMSGGAYAVDVLKFDGRNWTNLNKLVNISDEAVDDEYGEIPRAYAVSFVSSVSGQPKAYIATGKREINVKTCWGYDPQTDRWTRLADLPSRLGARVQASSYVLDGFGYVVSGGIDIDCPEYNDVWRFDPLAQPND